MVTEAEHQRALAEVTRLQAQLRSIGRVDPGVASPKETWPDDKETNEAIAAEDSFAGALFEIADKYGANVTNNYPRWQNGVFLREVGEFIADVTAAAEKHLGTSSAADAPTPPLPKES
ncbi:hypothetical protein WMO79_00875 [Micrococcaceae bacterium Sec7.4]